MSIISDILWIRRIKDKSVEVEDIGTNGVSVVRLSEKIYVVIQSTKREEK